MKTELEQQLRQAELDKIRAIDRVKKLKARIEEAEKGPSIYELMPIGSVWCGWGVKEHDRTSAKRPVRIDHEYIYSNHWPIFQSLHKLIAEQKRLDAMKRAADAALGYCEKHDTGNSGLIHECQEYKKIIENNEG